MKQKKSKGGGRRLRLCGGLPIEREGGREVGHTRGTCYHKGNACSFACAGLRGIIRAWRGVASERVWCHVMLKRYSMRG